MSYELEGQWIVKRSRSYRIHAGVYGRVWGTPGAVAWRLSRPPHIELPHEGYDNVQDAFQAAVRELDRRDEMAVQLREVRPRRGLNDWP